MVKSQLQYYASERFGKILEKIMGKNGLQVISKITGLILAALSAQIVFTGIKNFLGL